MRLVENYLFQLTMVMEHKHVRDYSRLNEYINSRNNPSVTIAIN